MRRASMTLGLLIVALSCGGAGAGCSSDEEEQSADSCVSTREFYTSQVYGKAMVACASCHTPGGAAQQAGAKFKMYRDT